MDAVIRLLRPDDRPAATSLLDEAVGAGFWSFTDDADPLSFVADSGAGLAGAVLTRLSPADDADARTAFGPAAASEAAGGAATGRVLHVRVIAVAPEARRAGLARRLLARAEAEARERDATAAFLYAWLPAGRADPVAVRFYLAAGYDAGPDIRDFYAAGSVAAGARCPYCGDPPCRCAARPFTKCLRA